MPASLYAEITLGTGESALSLLADVAGLDALLAETPMTVYEGIESTTIQVAPVRLKGTPITLTASGTDVVRGAGHLSAATLAALLAIQDATAAGTPVAYADSLGNEGTVIVRKVSGIPQLGEELELIALRLEAVWATVTKRLGASYSGG